jgi:hypothetical protein
MLQFVQSAELELIFVSCFHIGTKQKHEMPLCLIDAAWFGLILDQAIVRGFMMELLLY